MKILYVTRHFNHSGYIILERLISEGIPIAAILLHDAKDPWRHPVKGFFLRMWYVIKCTYYGCEQLRTVRTEEALAKRNNIPIIWAGSIKDDGFYEELKSLTPDIIVLGGGWHELIPKRVFEFPALGCINTHPSLLPEFRGTSITRWQVLHGVERSGSTIHYVDDKFDTGGALAQNTIGVPSSMCPQELFKALAFAGAELMPGLLRSFEHSGKQRSFTVEHDRKYYNYFKRWLWSKEGLWINWSQNLRAIHFFVLANTQESYEYLGPFFKHDKHTLILRKTVLHDVETMRSSVPLATTAELQVVAIKNGSVFLHRVGDPNVLELQQVQRFDEFYRYRRGRSAASLLHLVEGDTFTTYLNQ